MRGEEAGAAGLSGEHRLRELPGVEVNHDPVDPLASAGLCVGADIEGRFDRGRGGSTDEEEKGGEDVHQRQIVEKGSTRGEAMFTARI